MQPGMEPQERFIISDLLLVLLTILFPPFGVFTVSGCGASLCINILLTILGYLPGHIHAFYVEYLHFKERDEREQARAYVAVPSNDYYGQQQQQQQQQQEQQPPKYQGYGAV